MPQPFSEPCGRGLIRAEPCPREGGRELPAVRRRWVLAACVLASSMGFIDGSALTVALPALRASLSADLAAVQWVVNGYVLALASLTLVGGALADVYGKARMLALGCLLFGLASVGCALSPSAAMLIGARLMQGTAAALLTPASLALIGAVYPKEERNRAIGVWAAASALTTAAGPVLGGWLTQHFGWPFVFWINPPLAAVAVAILVIAAPRDRREARRFDAAGAALLAAALGAIAWALSQIGPSAQGPEPGGAGSRPSAAVLGLAAAAGLAGLVLYALWERRSSHPMTPPRLAANRSFAGLNVATLLVYGGLSLMFFLLPFDLVDRRGLSPTGAGLAFLPFTLGVGFLSRAFGALADAVGARLMLIAGPVGAAFAYAWMAATQDWSLGLGVIAPMTLLGLSFAVLVAPLTATVLSSLSPAEEGLASGVNNAASRIAQLVGVAFAAGVASLAGGYQIGFATAAAASLLGALAIARTVSART
ncbi:MAG: MFS transporter [Alphaproteobacteria bacterium]|nr:MFS transporter [Alphaproteobacteria bacterium]